VREALLRVERQKRQRQDGDDATPYQVQQRPPRSRRAAARLNGASHHTMNRANEMSAGMLFAGLNTVRFGNSNRLCTYSPSHESPINRSTRPTGWRAVLVLESREVGGLVEAEPNVTGPSL
jgi:hypothetical protein